MTDRVVEDRLEFETMLLGIHRHEGPDRRNVIKHDTGQLTGGPGNRGVGPTARLQQTVVPVDIETLELLPCLAADPEPRDIGFRGPDMALQVDSSPAGS